MKTEQEQLHDKAEYLRGYHDGYTACSQVCELTHCYVSKRDTPYNEGFIDGWDECNAVDFEDEIGLYD